MPSGEQLAGRLDGLARMSAPFPPSRASRQEEEEKKWTLELLLLLLKDFGSTALHEVAFSLANPAKRFSNIFFYNSFQSSSMPGDFFWPGSRLPSK